PSYAADLGGVAAASPSMVPAGGSTLLTVNVTPADGPPSTNILVTVNVSSIGGPPSILLRDDGTNGDVTAGDNVFSARVTVSQATTLGVKSLAVTISDAQSRTATTSIGLIVTAPLQIVISQIYGGGGNSGATYKNDFIELFNRGAAPVNVTGWSVQYASATGTTWQVTNLSGSISPGQYYLIQELAGAGGTTNLPTPDA